MRGRVSGVKGETQRRRKRRERTAVARSIRRRLEVHGVVGDEEEAYSAEHRIGSLGGELREGEYLRRIHPRRRLADVDVALMEEHRLDLSNKYGGQNDVVCVGRESVSRKGTMKMKNKSEERKGENAQKMA
jgi:hypothetical protein